MGDYLKSHPLWNRDEAWIAAQASRAVAQSKKVPDGASQVVISAVGLAAIVHMAKADAARVEELTKAIQAAHDDLSHANYPTESYVRLMDIVPEIMP
jgi:hypothetical protein